MTDPFELSSRYYDLLYSEKDTSAEVNYLDHLIRKNGIEGNSLLEFGSGTGRHGCLLATRGYQVHGIELSKAMVLASQKNKGFSCEQGDITLTKVAGRFNAVLSLFHVISYQITNEKINAVFRNASYHLSVGGLFIFDVWYSPAVATQRPERRIKRLKTMDLEITRIAEPQVYPNDNRVDVHYTIISHDLKTGQYQSFEELHPMRHFSLPEIDLISEYHGFQRLTAEEWLTGNPVSPDTWGVCVVLQKQ